VLTVAVCPLLTWIDSKLSYVGVETGPAPAPEARLKILALTIVLKVDKDFMDISVEA